MPGLKSPTPNPPATRVLAPRSTQTNLESDGLRNQAHMKDHERLPAPLTANWDWQLDAACRGMDVETFFHPLYEARYERSTRVANAKAVCQRCPVVTQCRAHALAVREPYGIWGGLSEDERATILGVRKLQYPGS